MTAAQRAARGLLAGAAAFTIWGLFPLYLHPLREVPAMQVVAHRISWSCLFILAWMLARGELRVLAAIFTQPALLSRLLLTALLISTNWLVYVWGVSHGHIVDTSLGYYINPLINVVLGIFVLRERLNPVQWTAVALAGVAVAYVTYEAGRLPWIALTLAFSFSLYGLVRKLISVDALPGLATETLLLLPLATGYLWWCAHLGSGAFPHAGATVSALLIGMGLVSALPLVPVRLRRAPAPLLHRRHPAVHRTEPAAGVRRTGLPRALRRRPRGGLHADLAGAGDLRGRRGVALARAGAAGERARQLSSSAR